MMQQFDIIIVGGGLVGLSLALSLAQEQFKIALIDKSSLVFPSPDNEQYSNLRVVAISPESEQLYKRLEVWEKILNNASMYEGMRVWDETGTGAIEFQAADYFLPHLGHIVENQCILFNLYEALTQFTHVKFFNQAQIESCDFFDDAVQVTLLGNQILTARLIVGADGAHSWLRRKLEFKTKNWSYQQQAIIANVQSERPHKSCAYQRFALDGPLAFLPLKDPHHTSIVWTTTLENASTLLANANSDFNQVLTKASGHFLGELNVISERKAFPLFAQYTTHYSQHRALLIGDAAHHIHPMAGQGVNLGLQDVQCLVKELVSARNNQRDYGLIDVLKRYERKRQGLNQAMLWSLEFFKHLFGSENNMLLRLRNWGLSYVNHQTSLKKFFVNKASGN